MSHDSSLVLTLIVGVLVAIVLLKVLGLLVSLAIKVVLLAVLVGVGGIVYLSVKKKLRGPGA